MTSGNICPEHNCEEFFCRGLHEIDLHEAKMELERHHRDFAQISLLAEAVEKYLIEDFPIREEDFDWRLGSDATDLLNQARSAIRQIRNIVG